ncbi:P-loop containing nucleoside triphosphate hydrolase protein [Nadsonia fulvescens var. elongata DSM 6958]|uniref:p-loop containing nucleoside triphosphate hydrolase protein n=1 Tax=Nadsonia fulvescens var. elongata DSM 6958 TaxID=857566 RepID=A0A1E3PQQ0_9ASCO|nr:P-loop containing nucleoside triphosphate hydrolase protein [Nadsonia fulvescens var. elongata DSM 6958]
MTNLPLIQLSKALIRPLNAGYKGLGQFLFKNPISLTINPGEKWAITGPRKSDLISVLAAKGVPNPASSRTYPFLKMDAWPSAVIQTVEFKGSIDLSHISARYEFFKDEFDLSLEEDLSRANSDRSLVNTVLIQLKLDELNNRWVGALSNGQMRRARLAKMILKKPLLLFVDDPFLGLDPEATNTIVDILGSLAPNPEVVVGLRGQDVFPDWITHVAITDANGISAAGPIKELQSKIDQLKSQAHQNTRNLAERRVSRRNMSEKNVPEYIIELENANVSYNGQVILKDLQWKVARGERWHLRGNNGTGKSTVISLITADHPQSWNKTIKMYGKPRKTGEDSYFSINSSIRGSSPETHALFPSSLTVTQAISSGYVTGSMHPPKVLSDKQSAYISSLIQEFGLHPDTTFGKLSLSDQKTVLFLRSIVSSPEILILDEAFSGMDEARIDQCKEFVDTWDGTVIAIAHLSSELPSCDKFIRLMPNGLPYEQGHVE